MAAVAAPTDGVKLLPLSSGAEAGKWFGLWQCVPGLQPRKHPLLGAGRRYRDRIVRSARWLGDIIAEQGKLDVVRSYHRENMHDDLVQCQGSDLRSLVPQVSSTAAWLTEQPLCWTKLRYS
jgi:hypothetical protein